MFIYISIIINKIEMRQPLIFLLIMISKNIIITPVIPKIYYIPYQQIYKPSAGGLAFYKCGGKAWLPTMIKK